MKGRNRYVDTTYGPMLITQWDRDKVADECIYGNMTPERAAWNMSVTPRTVQRWIAARKKGNTNGVPGRA